MPASEPVGDKPKEYERIPTRIRAVEFQPDAKPWPLNVHQKYRETCSDPQCGDSTWDHECDAGEAIDEWYVFNRLHKSGINLKPGDMIRVDDPNDTYPIDRATFDKTYRVPVPAREPGSREREALREALAAIDEAYQATGHIKVAHSSKQRERIAAILTESAAPVQKGP